MKVSASIDTFKPGQLLHVVKQRLELPLLELTLGPKLIVKSNPLA
jgi:hypothetical protein